jgi:signal transduction histidine kinase
MRSVARSAARPVSSPPIPKRSKQTGTLVAWSTDENLKLIAVTRAPGTRLRALPVVGQVIVKSRRRTGILDTSAHLQALQGKAATYRFRLFRRHYEVRVIARRDRKKIIGVRGTLQLCRARASRNGGAAILSPILSASRAMQGLPYRRRQSSIQSAIRSLELAKAVADTARVNAEIRSERAERQQHSALSAQMKAEEQERRSRMLADASAILDSSFDRREVMDRLGRLLILRFADWVVHYSKEEDDQLRRVMVQNRDADAIALLEKVFPEEVGPGVFESRLFEPRLFDSGFFGPGLFGSGLFGSGLFGSGLFGSGFLERIIPSRRKRPPASSSEDAESSSFEPNLRRIFRDMKVQSLIRVPVHSHGRLAGLLFLGSNDPGRLFSTPDLQMMRDLSMRIGMAWASSRLYDEAQKEIALRREIEARLRVFNVELERRVGERTALLEDAIREANSFAYTVAHDLRAPLRAITGFCQALKEDYSGGIDAVGRDYLDRVVQGAMRMDDLIRDLLDYARLNRAEIRKGVVNLDELVETVLDPMRSDLEEKKARVQVARPLGRVIGQDLILGQAVTNILSNAVKFVAPGVTPDVQIRTERLGNGTRLLIEDNGIGIAPEHQERIFGIFERLNRAELYPGTGIGLAIVRRAVERLGGSVGVESRPAEGSRFWIELPSA